MNFAPMMARIGLVVVAFGVTACESSLSKERTTDGGLDGGPLRDGAANIWVDPDGCQHWYIDDGLEGYMSPRLNRDGTPRCQDMRGEIIMKDGTRIPAEQEPVAAG
ncbi:hypothetical protein ACJ5NV_01995 [Loktanella agnita]|uniref:hypothetical protein n=1 Tax=Loktanella agnita TaxID=287097 RepID=UPI003985A779